MGSWVHVHQVSQMSNEGHRFESCSYLGSYFIPPSHPLSLSPSVVVGYTGLFLASVSSLYLVSSRGVSITCHTHPHMHADPLTPTHRCPKTSLFDLWVSGSLTWHNHIKRGKKDSFSKYEMNNKCLLWTKLELEKFFFYIFYISVNLGGIYIRQFWVRKL